MDMFNSSANTTYVWQRGDTVPISSWKTVVTAMVLSLIIVLGFIGNLFSLLVWIKGRRRKTSTAKYLSALAVADMFVLSTSATEFWVAHVLHEDMRVYGSVLCKLLFFCSYVGPAFSAWILVAVTMERTLSVWIPHRVSLACNQRTAVGIVVIQAVLLCVIYSLSLLGVDIVTLIRGDHTWLECTVLSAHADILNILVYIDLVLFFAVPFATMLLCNLFILTKVVWLAASRKEALQARGGQTDRAASKNKKMLRTVTKRIVLLSVTYCVCNAPLSILNVLLLTPGFVGVADHSVVDSLRIPFTLLMYFNNSINFLLYCAIGSGFRRDLTGIFRPISRSTSS